LVSHRDDGGAGDGGDGGDVPLPRMVSEQLNQVLPVNSFHLADWPGETLHPECGGGGDGDDGDCLGGDGVDA